MLIAYLDGGVLKTAVSGDLGKTFTALNSSIDTGLDFSSAGRAGLCWMGGETCLLIYASGNNCSRKSTDGGKTFGSSVTMATSGPYSGVSLGAHAGTAFGTATAERYSVHLVLGRSGRDVDGGYLADGGQPGLHRCQPLDRDITFHYDTDQQ